MRPDNLPSQRTVSEYLLRRLKHFNVSCVFGIPGDYSLPFFDQLLDVDHGVQHGGTTNELNAGYMAQGYSKLDGFGVVAVTFGPGSLSVTNAIAGCYADDVPVILIAGAPPVSVIRNPQGRFYHHVIGTNFDANIQVFTPITLHARRIMEFHEAAVIIDTLVQEAVQFKKPVYLEIPYDLQLASIPPPATLLLREPVSNPEVLRSVVQEVLRILQAPKQTRYVVVGHLVQRLDLG